VKGDGGEIIPLPLLSPWRPVMLAWRRQQTTSQRGRSRCGKETAS